MLPYLLALACAIALSTGQILFKACANEMARHGGPTLAAAAYLLVAMLIYGVTSLAWVWLLRSVELGKVYPFMALAFVLVPLGSHFFFGETFSPRYYAGTALVIGGLLLVTLRS